MRKFVKKIEVKDITKMTDYEINKLECGDLVVKITVEGQRELRHTYVVSYKENNQGICLSYSACGYLETVAYDFNAETGHWVYNSTDVWQAQQ